MKKIILLVLLVGLWATTSFAGITVERIWAPHPGLAPANTSVSFVQFRIHSDTTERIQALQVALEGPLPHVCGRILVQDGFGEVVGWVQAYEEGQGGNKRHIPLSLVVKAGDTAFLTLKAEMYPWPEMVAHHAGALIGVDVTALFTQAAVSGEMPIKGARHTVNSNVRVGVINDVRRGDSHQNITAGPNQVLGSIQVQTLPTEGLSVFNIPVTVHSTGGDSTQIRNLMMVDHNGAKVAQGYGPRVCDESSGRTVTFVFDSTTGGGGVVLPAGSTTTFFFKGDTTDAFAWGGTVALETDVAKWKVWNVTSGYESVTSPFSPILSATRFIRVPRLDVSAMSPEYQQVQSGVAQAQILQILLDATQSSEDIRVTMLPLLIVTVPKWAHDLSELTVYDGTVKLGGWPGQWINESGVTRLRVGLVDGLVVPKGTKKVLTVRVDINPRQGTGFYGIALGDFEKVSAVSVQTGRSPSFFITPGYTIVHAVGTGGKG